jgi:hypothetical protein
MLFIRIISLRGRIVNLENAQLLSMESVQVDLRCGKEKLNYSVKFYEGI